MAPRGQDLDQIRAPLAAMLPSVHTAIDQAATNLVEPGDELQAIPQVLLELDRELDDLAAVVMARSGKPGTELRPLLVGVHATSEVECIAEAARDLLLLARSRQGKSQLPTELKAILHRMNDVALSTITRAQGISTSPEPTACGQESEQGRAEMEGLQQQLYRVLNGTTEYSPRTAIDVTLAARAFERCADHALALARHVAMFANETPVT